MGAGGHRTLLLQPATGAVPHGGHHAGAVRRHAGRPLSGERNAHLPRHRRGFLCAQAVHSADGGGSASVPGADRPAAPVAASANLSAVIGRQIFGAGAGSAGALSGGQHLAGDVGGAGLHHRAHAVAPLPTGSGHVVQRVAPAPAFLHAVSLLEQGKTVQDVALDVGYSSASAFIVMFQQIAGTTLSAFAVPDSVAHYFADQ